MTSKKETDKKIATGTLVKFSKEEEEEILNGTHNFSYLSIVKSETSTSTSTRLITDTLTSNGKGSSFSLEKKVPTSEIGDSFGSLVASITMDTRQISVNVICEY